MQDAVGALLGQIRQRLERVRGHGPVGDLDADHPRGVPHRVGAFDQVARGVVQGPRLDPVEPPPVVVPLTIDAASEPGLGKHLFVEFALPAQCDLRLEDVDLFGQVLRDPV